MYSIVYKRSKKILFGDNKVKKKALNIQLI